MKSQTCEHNPIAKWIASIPADFITSGVSVVDNDSTISSYIPFRHKHILFSFVPRVCTVSNHDLHSYIRKWSRDHLCIFAKLTPVHTTDVKDFAKSTEIIRKKHQICKFLKDYIRLLRLFLYICSISLVVKPIGLPRDNRTLRSKPISQFFSVVTVRSLSLVSPCAAEAYVFYIFQTLQIDSAWESLLLCYC